MWHYVQGFRTDDACPTQVLVHMTCGVPQFINSRPTALLCLNKLKKWHKPFHFCWWFECNDWHSLNLELLNFNKLVMGTNSKNDIRSKAEINEQLSNNSVDWRRLVVQCQKSWEIWTLLIAGRLHLLAITFHCNTESLIWKQIIMAWQYQLLMNMAETYMSTANSHIWGSIFPLVIWFSSCFAGTDAENLDLVLHYQSRTQSTGYLCWLL